jgi:transcriptional regulator with XRE-family HTH domain
MELPANRIKELRESAGASHADLAVLCEVSEMTVRRWEAGKVAIADPQKFKLAEFFEVTPNYLMGWPEGAAAA